MINKEVIPAFDMLLEELERIIPDLNQQGKELMDEKRYTQAHEVINKAQAVVAFEDKVKSLREEWLRMNVPPTRPPVQPPKPLQLSKTPGRSFYGKLSKGLRTTEEDFRTPILSTLVKQGGRLPFRRLIEILEKDMQGQLTKDDWDLLADGRSIRWKNTVGWTKKPLKDLGYLSTTAPNGIWEITETGREFITGQNKTKQDEPERKPASKLPENLHYAISVYKLMHTGAYSFNQACKVVATNENLGLINIVTDACTKSLRLTEDRFNALTKNQQLFTDRLGYFYPDQKAEIIAVLKKTGG